MTQVMPTDVPYLTAPVLAIAALAIFGGCFAAAQDAGPRCAPTIAGTANVAAIRDGRTFTLNDGRTVRLAGIETTGPAAAGMLAALTDGAEVALRVVDDRLDRYGRTVAFVTAGTRDIQRDLLSGGNAQIGPYLGDAACLAQLRAAEAEARKERRGLWAAPSFALLDAGKTEALAAASGQFRVVEGKVVSVRESGAMVYINFGRRWSRDFSISLLKRNRRMFAAAGIDTTRLEGRRLIVRGVLEHRSGPLIEAAWPDQIEIVE